MITVQLHHLTLVGMREAAEELGLEPQQYAELVSVFLTRTDDGIRELEAALNSSDDNAARRAVHSIKGTALNMRLTMVSDPSVAMEAAMKSGHKEAYAERLAQLRSGLDQLAAEAQLLGIEG